MRSLLLFFILFNQYQPIFAQENLRNEEFPNIEKEYLIKLPQITFSIERSSQTTTCQYPNQGLKKGNDIIPSISDVKRKEAIIKLIEKIIECHTLPFKEDGQIFSNREGKLPPKPKGYYREYTLVVPKDAPKEFYIGNTHYSAYPTYGARGPERIIIGGGEEIYYTPTHYDSFVKIEIVEINR